MSLAKALDIVRYGAALALFGIASATFSLLAGPLRMLLPRRAGTQFGRAAISACFRVYLRLIERLGIIVIDLSPLDALRDEPGLLVVANHPSIADAVLLVSRLPRAACIMKGSLADNLVLGGGARLAGYIRNSSPRHLVRGGVDCLRDGGQLLVFPEGTRTRSATLDVFTAGFAVVARRAGAPVQTVVIETVWHVGWRRSIFDPPDLPIVYRVRLGPRYDPGSDPRALAAEVESDLGAALRAGMAGAPRRRDQRRS